MMKKVRIKPVKITKLNTPNQNKGRNGCIPKAIVCHRTCGKFDGAVSWLRNVQSGASAHFVIAKDGRIAQLVEIENTAWCNGTSTSSTSSKYYKNSTLEIVRNTKTNANDYTISVEFEGLADEKGDLTKAQFNSAVELFCFIVAEVKRIYSYDLKVDSNTLVGHCHITPKWKPNCPGSSFPYAKLISNVKENTEVMETKKFIINGKELELECSVSEGVIRPPVRAIAEQLNCNVNFDSKTDTVIINSK